MKPLVQLLVFRPQGLLHWGPREGVRVPALGGEGVPGLA